MQKELDGIEDKLIQAPLEHMDGKFSAEILEKVIDRLETKRINLKKEIREFGTLDDDFMDITKSFMDFICLAKSNFSAIPMEIKRTLFELFFESAQVTRGELCLKHTPYLEKLIEIRGNALFEPPPDQSPSWNTGPKNQNLQCGGERGIRTLGDVAASTVFKTVAFDHSAISPRRILGEFTILTSSNFRFFVFSRGRNSYPDRTIIISG